MFDFDAGEAQNPRVRADVIVFGIATVALVLVLVTLAYGADQIRRGLGSDQIGANRISGGNE